MGIDPVHSTPFAEDGYLYGVDRQGSFAVSRCRPGDAFGLTFDLMPDRRGTQSGTAFVVKNRDRFFIFNDSGELVVARMDRTAYKEFGRVKVLEATTEGMGRLVVWSHPAFAHRCMYARNDDELVCISLAK